MASGQGAGAQPGMHVIIAGRSEQMVNRQRRLPDEQRAGIDVFAACGEQVAERTFITANRVGQIGNDVIKMRTGGQRKTFVPV